MFEFTVLDMCGLAKLLIVSIPTKFATGYFLKTLCSLYLLPVLILHYGRSNVCTVLVVQEMPTPLSDPRHTKAGGKFTTKFAITISRLLPQDALILIPFYQCLSYTTDALVYVQSV